MAQFIKIPGTMDDNDKSSGVRGGGKGGLPRAAIRRGSKNGVIMTKGGDKGHQTSHDFWGGKIAVHPGRR